MIRYSSATTGIVVSGRYSYSDHDLERIYLETCTEQEAFAVRYPTEIGGDHQKISYSDTPTLPSGSGGDMMEMEADSQLAAWILIIPLKGMAMYKVEVWCAGVAACEIPVSRGAPWCGAVA